MRVYEAEDAEEAAKAEEADMWQFVLSGIIILINIIRHFILLWSCLLSSIQ